MTLQIENRIETMTRRLKRVFASEQATVLAETIHDAYADLVKTSDFNELKEIVRNLAQAQIRTESRMEELAHAQQELAQAQGRTESRMEELAQAQGRTESRMEELAQAQQELTQAQRDTDSRLGKLTDVVTNLAQEVGGLSRSASYSLENEAYRQLPAYLESKHGIVLQERLVRTEMNGEEVNIFALGQRNGTPIVLVGETKLQLDRRRGGREAVAQVLDQLERKVEAVQPLYPEREVVRLLVTHYARPVAQEEARRRNVIIAQSFDW